MLAHAVPAADWVPRSRAAVDGDAAAAALSASLGLPLTLARLLVARGWVEEPAARSFLRPRLEQLHDPSLMADLDRAVERLRRAIRQRETILVHGDYDVDGISATALYTRVLRGLGARVAPFVPHRIRHGYDLGPAGLAAARAAGARLILTADCGILATQAVAEAAAAGIDVLVTDHHTPGPELPAAAAVLNPRRPDCPYPEKGLAGAGVAFKLCQGLVAAEGGDEQALLWQLDLVALATIADLVPLVGENRVLARTGLRVLSQTRNAGVRALLRVCELEAREELAAGHVSHGLAPRINAAGRIGEPDLALELLLCDDAATAAPLAERLEALNRERRDIDRRTLERAEELLAADFDDARDYGVVLAESGWHPGVIGIVASRIVERVHRPAILIALRGAGEAARGSARSIRGFDLLAAIRGCGEHLVRFGGHRQAAGLDILPDRVDAFREAFNAAAAAELRDRPLGPRVEYDLPLGIGDATPELGRLLAHMGPFGVGNPAPVFVARGVGLARPPKTVGQRHLRLVLQDGDARIGAIGFGMAELGREAWLRGPFEVAFQLQEDRWTGGGALQARLVDLRPAG